jgi:hypothetical protein
MLSDVQIEELEEELLRIEYDLEIVPLMNTEEIKRLSKMKEIILNRLGRYKKLF